MFSFRQAVPADAPAIQALARAQAACIHAQDPRLPEDIVLPPWLMFPSGGACWLAVEGSTLIAVLCAVPEVWLESSPFANVFPRRYLRLRYYTACDYNPALTLPSLLKHVAAWPEAVRLPSHMIMAPATDVQLGASLAMLDFLPYHTIAHRPTPRTLPPGDARGVTVREAKREDVPAVAALMAESWQFHAAHQPAIDLTPTLQQGCLDQAWELFGDGVTRVLLVAEAGCDVVGFFAAGVASQEPGVRPALFTRGHYGDIFEVAVRAGMRRRGVGMLMYRAAVAWFQQREVPKLFVNYAPTNPLSRRFWPKLGFTDAWINWWRA